MMNSFKCEQRSLTSVVAKVKNTHFGQYKKNILGRLKQTVEQCRLNYVGSKELASDSDDKVIELCEALQEAFSYGLRQQQGEEQHSLTITAVNLFQNMHEIVTGNSSDSSLINDNNTFWDFCEEHLTSHERERFLNLKYIYTKHGRGAAFIRATLNENSLQRYLLCWLDDRNNLERHYTQWSLLLDEEIRPELVRIVGSLNEVFFALTVDSRELDSSSLSHHRKEEPLICAPAPIPVQTIKRKQRKLNAIERPIITNGSDDTPTKELQQILEASPIEEIVEYVATGIEMEPSQSATPAPPDPIEPELEFLKQPLPEINAATDDINNDDNKSETTSSSQYSKSSSSALSQYIGNNNNVASLEERLTEMNERCALLETRVAQLSLENRQLVRRLTQQFNQSGINPSSSLTTNFLITIPHAKLVNTTQRGRGNCVGFYTYEIQITMKKNLEYWSLNKRYREFHKLHKSLLRTHPCVAAIAFPPKKHFGNMNLVFVEERRQQLQIYLLNLVEMLPKVEACKSKTELTKVFPFFS